LVIPRRGGVKQPREEPDPHLQLLEPPAASVTETLGSHQFHMSKHGVERGSRAPGGGWGFHGVSLH